MVKCSSFDAIRVRRTRLSKFDQKVISSFKNTLEVEETGNEQENETIKNGKSLETVRNAYY